MTTRTLMPALKPVVLVTGVVLCEAEVAVEVLFVLWVTVLNVGRFVLTLLLVLLDEGDITVELKLVPRIDKVSVVETLALVFVVLEGEVEEGIAKFVPVLLSPETPMIVCAIPPAIEKVPFLLAQSHVPSAAAEAQHQFPSSQCSSEPSFPESMSCQHRLSCKLR